MSNNPPGVGGASAPVVASEIEREHADARVAAEASEKETAIRADERRKVARRLQALLNAVAPHVAKTYFQASGLVLAKDEAADALKRSLIDDKAGPQVVFSSTGNLSVAGLIASLVRAACGGTLTAIPNEAKRELAGWRVSMDEPVRAKGYADTLPDPKDAKRRTTVK